MQNDSVFWRDHERYMADPVYREAFERELAKLVQLTEVSWSGPEDPEELN